MNSKNLLSIQDISKSISDEFYLTDINLDLYQGEVIGLIGKNGSGKSSLIFTILNLLTPDKGRVKIEGELALDDKIRRKVVGLTDFPGFFLEFSAIKNLNILCNLLQIDTTKVPLLLKEFDLQGSEKTQVKKYSKGMMQRLNLASAFLREDKSNIFILDEPTENLDISSIQLLKKK